MKNAWEIRSTLANRIVRVLFAVARDEMILLHGFIQQTQRTPMADIAVAEKRWQEWESAQRQ